MKRINAIYKKECNQFVHLFVFICEYLVFFNYLPTPYVLTIWIRKMFIAISFYRHDLPLWTLFYIWQNRNVTWERKAQIATSDFKRRQVYFNSGSILLELFISFFYETTDYLVWSTIYLPYIWLSNAVSLNITH